MKMTVWLGGVALALILGALALLALHEDGDGTGNAPPGRLRIVATTSILADAARIIGGPAVDVEALMGPGVDPHLYKASAGDVERLRRADLVLYNGLHLEGKLGEVLEGLRAQGRRPVAAWPKGLRQNGGSPSVAGCGTRISGLMSPSGGRQCGRFRRQLPRPRRRW